jgi:uncharacterized protein YeeX (DUF496 family)
MKNIKKSKWEEEYADEEFTPFEKIRELSAEILLESRERWKKEILDHMSDQEIRDYIEYYRKDFAERTRGISESPFIEFAETELGLRNIFKRAKEIGSDYYCIYHDCASTDCPEDSHLD